MNLCSRLVGVMVLMVVAMSCIGVSSMSVSFLEEMARDCNATRFLMEATVGLLEGVQIVGS